MKPWAVGGTNRECRSVHLRQKTGRLWWTAGGQGQTKLKSKSPGGGGREAVGGEHICWVFTPGILRTSRRKDRRSPLLRLHYLRREGVRNTCEGHSPGAQLSQKRDRTITPFPNHATTCEQASAKWWDYLQKATRAWSCVRRSLRGSLDPRRVYDSKEGRQDGKGWRERGLVEGGKLNSSMGQQGGSVGRVLVTSALTRWLFHMVEVEKWLPQAVLWLPYMYHGTH